MLESERRGVQGDSFDFPSRMRCHFGLVSWVAEYGVPCIGKLNANLISFAGFQFYFDMRRVGHPSHDAVVGHREFGVSRRRCSVAVEVLAERQVGFKGSLVAGHYTGDNRGVDATRLSLFKLFDQLLGKQFLFSKDQQSADVTVQPMDKPGILMSS